MLFIDKIKTYDKEDWQIEWEVKIIGDKFYAKKFVKGEMTGEVKKVTKEWIKERLNIEITL